MVESFILILVWLFACTVVIVWQISCFVLTLSLWTIASPFFPESCGQHSLKSWRCRAQAVSKSRNSNQQREPGKTVEEEKAHMKSNSFSEKEWSKIHTEWDIYENTETDNAQKRKQSICSYITNFASCPIHLLFIQHSLQQLATGMLSLRVETQLI